MTTAPTRARRAVAVPVAAVLVVLALLVAGCGVGEEASPRVRDDAEVPFGLLESTTTTAVAPSPAADERACLVDDERLVLVPRSDGSTLLERLATVATADESDEGLRTALPDPSQVVGVDVAGGIATIDLAADFVVGSPSAQRLATAQLVCTATQTPGVGQVSFTLDGVSLAVPTGEGALTDEPVSIDDYMALLER